MTGSDSGGSGDGRADHHAPREGRGARWEGIFRGPTHLESVLTKHWSRDLATSSPTRGLRSVEAADDSVFEAGRLQGGRRCPFKFTLALAKSFTASL